MRLVAVLGLLATASTSLAQDTAPGAVRGVVRDHIGGREIPGAAVHVRELHRSTRTDSMGQFRLDSLPPGQWVVRTTATSFEPQELVVRVVNATVHLDVELDRLQELPRVDVLASGHGAAEARHARALFEGAVLPAITTIASRQMRAMPTLVEPDVIRSLQALPGGVVLNDLNAALYVRGGAPDQNLILLDGAPVFGAHHAFGMTGVFNPDAVDRVDFSRGLHSVRHGGALSSVIDITQRDGGTSDSAFAEGGLSITGVRLALGGRAIGDRASWMVAGRRTHADAAVGTDMPFAYRDAQTRLTLSPDSSNKFTLSAFTSADRFALGTDGADLQSYWSNSVGSLSWTRTGVWTTRSLLWVSGYDASMDVGGDSHTGRTTDRVRAVGARVEAEHALLGGLLRAGAEASHTKLTLAGSELPGGYFTGKVEDSYVQPVLYGEWDRAFGRLRLVPGARAAYRGHQMPFHTTQRMAVFAGPRTPWLIEPRMAARLAITPMLSLSAGVSRSYQLMSTLRDERRVLPGPTFWFAHPDDAPASRSDAATVELQMWKGFTWQLTAGAYHKQLRDVAHWRPVSVRDLESVSYDDGTARGVELAVRRYGDRVSGWLGYSLSQTTFTEALTGKSYDAAWDRRHTANGALTWRALSRLFLSAQGQFGTGQPFYPFLGEVIVPFFEPFLGRLDLTRETPLWGPDQQRHEPYARLDLGARTSFGVRGAVVEPYLNLQNVAGRPNVLYYEAHVTTLPGGPGGFTRLDPVLRAVHMPAVMLPTIGFNIRF